MKYTIDTDQKTIELDGTYTAKEIADIGEKYPGYTFRTAAATTGYYQPIWWADPVPCTPYQPLRPYYEWPATCADIICDDGSTVTVVGGYSNSLSPIDWETINAGMSRIDGTANA